MKPAMTPQQAFLSGEKNSALAVYRELAVGQASLPFFLWYETVSCLSANLPGLPGFALRSLLYPTLLGASGARPAFGRGAVIRNPRRISLGRRVMVDDYAVLDVRGVEGQLTLSDHVSIGRFTTVAAKGGVISIGAGANIGSPCRNPIEGCYWGKRSRCRVLLYRAGESSKRRCGHSPYRSGDGKPWGGEHRSPRVDRGTFHDSGWGDYRRRSDRGSPLVGT